MKGAAVELPEAVVTHHSSGRLRIRIPSRQGDAAYFSSLQAACSRWREGVRPQANPLTGSLLFCADRLELQAVADFGRTQGLFDLTTDPPPRPPIMHEVVKPVAGFDRTLTHLTGGRVDLPSGIFLMLLAFGIYEIAKGRWTAPPWYTAFWYAFGLVSMFVVKKGIGDTPGREHT